MAVVPVVFNIAIAGIIVLNLFIITSSTFVNTAFTVTFNFFIITKGHDCSTPLTSGKFLSKYHPSFALSGANLIVLELWTEY
jgi:hypothetical protein